MRSSALPLRPDGSRLCPTYSPSFLRFSKMKFLKDEGKTDKILLKLDVGKIAKMTDENWEPFDEAPEQTRKMAEKRYFTPGC